MATAATNEILNLIRLASRPSSPTTSIRSKSERSDPIPSAPPLPTVTSPTVRPRTTDYYIPLKGVTNTAKTTNIANTSSSGVNQSVTSDILKEIRVTNLNIQRLQIQQSEIQIDIDRSKNLIQKQKYTYCNCCYIITVVLLFVIIGLLTYHIFIKKTD